MPAKGTYRLPGAPDKFDYYPTPPWTTLALLERLDVGEGMTCLEPAAGLGHMASVLRTRFGRVIERDITDHAGLGLMTQADFLKPLMTSERFDWVITNPPFNRWADFVSRALIQVNRGVAMFGRLQMLEGVERYNTLFLPTPPSRVLVFSDRVALARGGLPKPGTENNSVAYAWFIWQPVSPPTEIGETRVEWVPPGTRRRLLDALRERGLFE